MSESLVNPLSQQEQQRLLAGLWALLDRQVKSYHKSRHMGQNSSVSTELAQELMASVEYTIGLTGGLTPDQNLEEMLHSGQKILEEMLNKAGKILELVAATAPDWQTQCRWEAITCLRRYLQTYDMQHLAHRGPESLFYPVAVAVPEGLQGLELAQFYLNVLWEENQLMAAFSDEALDELWAKLPVDCLNQYEQVLLNAIGKAMVGEEAATLVFTDGQWEQLEDLPPEAFSQRWKNAVRDLPLGEYGALAAGQLFARAAAARDGENLRTIFL